MIHKFSSAKFGQRHALQIFLKKLLNVHNTEIVHFRLHSQKSSRYPHTCMPGLQPAVFKSTLHLEPPQFWSTLLKKLA